MSRLFRRNVGCAVFFALTINHHLDTSTLCAGRLSLYPERESNLGCIDDLGQNQVRPVSALGLSNLSISGDNQKILSYMV